MQIFRTIVSKTLLLITNHRVRCKLLTLESRRIRYNRLKGRTRLTTAIQSTEPFTLVVTPTKNGNKTAILMIHNDD
ncbi:hypothetical protein D3C80_2029940 [compost metagenome]